MEISSLTKAGVLICIVVAILSMHHWIKDVASQEVDDGFTCCWWCITKVK